MQEKIRDKRRCLIRLQRQIKYDLIRLNECFQVNAGAYVPFLCRRKMSAPLQVSCCQGRDAHRNWHEKQQGSCPLACRHQRKIRLENSLAHLVAVLCIALLPGCYEVEVKNSGTPPFVRHCLKDDGIGKFRAVIWQGDQEKDTEILVSELLARELEAFPNGLGRIAVPEENRHVITLKSEGKRNLQGFPAADTLYSPPWYVRCAIACQYSMMVFYPCAVWVCTFGEDRCCGLHQLYQFPTGWDWKTCRVSRRIAALSFCT